MNNISGFQRMRRLQAEKAEQERKKKLDEALNEYANDGENGSQGDPNDPGNTIDPGAAENAGEGQNEPDNDEPKQLTVEAIEAMDVDELKAELEKREIAFAHNTGEAKLREKLTDAING